MPAEFNLEQLESLKKDIEERKKGTARVDEQLGRQQGIPITDRRSFLSNLYASLNNGGNNPAVQALQAVNESVEAKKGSVGRPTNGGEYTQPTSVGRNTMPISMNEGFSSRDADFEREVQKRAEDMLRMNNMNQSNNTSLSEALMSSYKQTPHVGQTLSETYKPQVNYNGNINEAVGRAVTDIMSSSIFERMMSENYKNVITEVYTKEKIEKAVVEYAQSKDFKKQILEIVAESIMLIEKRRKELAEAKKTGGK